jgi:ferredoxin-like protein FixX
LHSKWSPVCTAVFRVDADIRINTTKMETLNVEQRQQLCVRACVAADGRSVQSCPTKVYSFNKVSKHVEITKSLRCTFCDECVLKAESFGADWKDLVLIRPKENIFHFSVEVTRCMFSLRVLTLRQTNGSLRPEEVVMLAMEVLTEKLKCVQKDGEK